MWSTIVKTHSLDLLTQSKGGLRHGFGERDSVRFGVERGGGWCVCVCARVEGEVAHLLMLYALLYMWIPLALPRASDLVLKYTSNAHYFVCLGDLTKL